MRKQLKILFSTLVLMAFAGQAAATHPCGITALSPNGGDAHSFAVMDDQSFLGNIGDHPVPKHDPVCKGDCDDLSALTINPVSLIDIVEHDLSKSKSFASISGVTSIEVPAAEHLRGPPPISKLSPAIPTSLFAQHTLLLI